jgi:hypothetical protein
LLAGETESQGVEIAPVVPGALAPSEHALQSLAIEIQPLVVLAVDTGSHIGEALRIDFVHLLLNVCLAVFELDGRDRAFR